MECPKKEFVIFEHVIKRLKVLFGFEICQLPEDFSWYVQLISI